jgi:hypothetical protein
MTTQHKNFKNISGETLNYDFFQINPLKSIISRGSISLRRCALLCPLIFALLIFVQLEDLFFIIASHISTVQAGSTYFSVWAFSAYRFGNHNLSCTHQLSRSFG